MRIAMWDAGIRGATGFELSPGIIGPAGGSPCGCLLPRRPRRKLSRRFGGYLPSIRHKYLDTLALLFFHAASVMLLDVRVCNVLRAVYCSARVFGMPVALKSTPGAQTLRSGTGCQGWSGCEWLLLLSPARGDRRANSGLLQDDTANDGFYSDGRSWQGRGRRRCARWGSSRAATFCM